MLNANYLLARLRREGVLEYLPAAYERLCMHEFVLSGAPMKRELGDQDARPGQATARLRRPPADGLLPADRRRGAAGRADRDRDQGDARPLRRDRRGDPARGARGSRGRPRTRRTRRRSGGSTRPPRRASRRAQPLRALCWRISDSRWTRIDRRAGRAEIAARAERELEALVAVSSPSGDIAGAEEAIALCVALLPPEAEIERVPCSTPGSAPDLIARIAGRARAGCCCWVTSTRSSATPRTRRCGATATACTGPAPADMKGGVVLSLGVARALAARPEAFAELAVLLVTDEEWRTAPVRPRRSASPATTPACASRPASARRTGEEGVVVRRKARRHAAGRARPAARRIRAARPIRVATRCSRSRETALALAALHDPGGPDAAERRADDDALGRGAQRRPGRRRAVLRHARGPARGVRAGARRGARARSTAWRSRRRWSAAGRGWTRARRPRRLLARAGERARAADRRRRPRRRQRREPLRRRRSR